MNWLRSEAGNSLCRRRRRLACQLSPAGATGLPFSRSIKAPAKFPQQQSQRRAAAWTGHFRLSLVGILSEHGCYHTVTQP
jgi:hypothetical protein